MSSLQGHPELALALVEQTGQAFFVYSIQTGSFFFRSSAFLSSFQIPEEHSGPDMLFSMVHEEDKPYVQEQLSQVLSKRELATLEFRCRISGQEEQWVCMKTSARGEGAELMVMGHVEDITSQRIYNDHLKRFSNKKNSVLNILAHDLAGPLGMIQNLSEMQAGQLKPEDDGDTQEVLQLIERISRQGSDLLREFMNQEFLESSHTDLVTRRVNLVQKLGEMLEEYKNVGGELMGQTVSFSCSSQEIYADIDDLKLAQVITNLISNALKFTPDGGTIDIRLEEEPDSVLVTVADTGVGIPRKFHATLFDKFTQARRPGLRGEKTIGLGMSIVKTIIDWHHGNIWFESEENKGTTFYIRLPRNPSQVAQKKQPLS
ncbi:PAS domain-containing sensor histidine kinase [Rufibacter latericius]|uniref:histidine kinase n=1 Tax=Rufibacter latericius TaxID=2487040 RepID=A0A3M9MLN9_9BACT|nr:HAMP domain-containing sensor histidine kinase [Rufibacter latericius]RNI26472.1 sensor histidine kinase [Rufibacter latericius]